MGDGHVCKGSCPVLPKLVHMRLKMLIIILEKHMGTYGLLYTSGRQTAFTMMIVLVYLNENDNDDDGDYDDDHDNTHVLYISIAMIDWLFIKTVDK